MIDFKHNYKALWALTLIGVMTTCLLVANYANANDEDEVKQSIQQTRDAQLIKDSKLYQEANYRSEVVETMVAQEPVVVHRRERAWYFVATEQKITGWLSMLNVRFNGLAKRKGELGIRSALGSLGKNTLPTQSTGIRGFDETDLKKAKADLKQLAIVNTFQVSTSQAEAFARQGQLKTNSNIEVK